VLFISEVDSVTSQVDRVESLFGRERKELSDGATARARACPRTRVILCSTETGCPVAQANASASPWRAPSPCRPESIGRRRFGGNDRPIPARRDRGPSARRLARSISCRLTPSTWVMKFRRFPVCRTGMPNGTGSAGRDAGAIHFFSNAVSGSGAIAGRLGPACLIVLAGRPSPSWPAIIRRNRTAPEIRFRLAVEFNSLCEIRIDTSNAPAPGSAWASAALPSKIREPFSYTFGFFSAPNFRRAKMDRV
jgi:hypothetical protein